MKWIISNSAQLDSTYDNFELKSFRFGNTFIASDTDFHSHSQSGITYYIFGKIYNLNKITQSPLSVNPAEVVATLYNQKGYDAFKILDGEFIIIIKSTDKTIAYRDRHGAGSQIYYTANYMASHPKLLKHFVHFKAEAHLDNLALFLKIGYIPAPDTALKGVKKLPAGHVLSISKLNAQIHDLFGYEQFGPIIDTKKISIEEATLQYETLHREAIWDRVSGQNKVQLLLSGGYDSGGNIAALRDVYQGEVLSYSIGFKNNPWSELPLAKILSETYGTKHFEYEINGSEIEFLPEIVDQMGDPFNESGMMVNFSAMKLVHQNREKGIILGGDGNDQHFGTAGRELAMHYIYKQNKVQLLQKLISQFSDLSIFEKDNSFFKVRFHNEKVLNILKSDNFGFRDRQIEDLFNQKIHLKQPSYLDVLPNTFENFDDLYRIHNFFGDIKQVINEIILFKASKLADMFNNSISFPYMSTDLYAFLKTMPRHYKLKGDVKTCSKGGGKSKFLHKSYLYPKLPKEITERKKQGGFAPLPIFFKDTKQFNKIAEQILNSEFCKQNLNRKMVEDFINGYRSQKDNVGNWFWYKQVQAFRIFNLLVLTLWWDNLIEGKTVEILSIK